MKRFDWFCVALWLLIAGTMVYIHDPKTCPRCAPGVYRGIPPPR